jgi:hypothetical protein
MVTRSGRCGTCAYHAGSPQRIEGAEPHEVEDAIGNGTAHLLSDRAVSELRPAPSERAILRIQDKDLHTALTFAPFFSSPRLPMFDDVDEPVGDEELCPVRTWRTLVTSTRKHRRAAPAELARAG